MRCPFCSALEDKVVDTRPSDNDQVIRRRRECIGCARRFTTYERVEAELPMVVKKDGRREPYDRQKLAGGLKKAVQKRPVSSEAVERAIDGIERGLQEHGDKEIASRQIGDAVMSALRALDEVACLRFASVYLSPRDVAELVDEVQRAARTKQSAEPNQPAPAVRVDEIDARKLT